MLPFLWQHRWFTLAACALFGLGVWQSIRLIVGPEVVADVVRRGLLIETVVATGSVQTPFRVSVASQITGTVDQVRVDEGQRVTQGQVLVVLDESELKSAVLQATGVVNQAEARMRQLQELTLPTAREALKDAQATSLNAQQTFDAVVSYINPGIDITRASLEAKLTVADPPTYLRQDMTVSVDIEVARRDDALREVNRDSGTSFLMVTHNLDLAKRCDRIIDVIDARIEPGS